MRHSPSAEGAAAAGGTFSLTAGAGWHIENELYHKTVQQSSILSRRPESARIQLQLIKILIFIPQIFSRNNLPDDELVFVFCQQNF
jgi:hypothetical protein